MRLVARGLYELNARIHRRVDLAAEFSLCGGDRLYHFGKRGVPDDKKIDVAAGPLLAARHRAVDKRGVDFAGKRVQRDGQDFRHAKGFDDQPAQLFVNRAGVVGAEIDLVPARRALDNAGVRERREVALQRARADVGRTGEFAQVEGLVGPPEKLGKNRLHGLAEQHRRERRAWYSGGLGCVCTHLTYEYTHFAYNCPALLADLPSGAFA